MAKTYYTYILASKQNDTLCVRVTSDIIHRMDQHHNGAEGSFTDKYSVHKLVYFEQTDSIEAAIYREKQLKHWNRAWKLELIERNNSTWKDLTDDF